jgi:imidazole glycerol-phosphate synthase subunit HisF
MKFRIIPTILTDGTTVVKGTKFNNWRTVGSAEATARLYAARDVDEIIFLDVTARSKGKSIDLDLITKFSRQLRVPFSVGGGIDSVEIASQCLRNGAEKIVLGTAAFEKPELISQLSSTFGSQAVVVAVDIPQSNGDSIAIESGRTIVEIAPRDFAAMAQERGAGEIIIQSVEKDGMQVGYDLQTIKKFAEFLTVPIIASSGAGSATDFAEAFYAGASGAAAGAIFQFTELTPSRVRRDLESLGIPVRRS